MWVYLWLAIFILMLIVEFFTFELVSIWVSAGALVSMILAACDVRYEVQIVVAVIVSILCLLFFRNILKNYLMRNKDKTNMDAIIGKQVKLLKEITEDSNGSVKVNDVVWTAKSKDGKPIEKDERVEIDVGFEIIYRNTCVGREKCPRTNGAKMMFVRVHLSLPQMGS